MKAIVTVGISASGKSTFAEKMRTEQGWRVIERDHIRRRLYSFTQWCDYKFTRTREEKVSGVVDGLIYGYAQEGSSVVVSDTNLNPKYRQALIEKLEGHGYEVEIKEFPITLKEAWKRDQNRVYSVGRDVIYKQYKQWNEYIGRKTYIPNPDKPDVILCDIDGTIAKMVDRGPFEWDRVGQDVPRYIIMSMVEGFANYEGAEIICLSGRDSQCREQTKEWLDGYAFDYKELYMRGEGDMRPDTEIKEELFWEHIADNYNVIAVVDDRPCMVRHWYEMGITNVVSVADPWEEF